MIETIHKVKASAFLYDCIQENESVKNKYGVDSSSNSKIQQWQHNNSAIVTTKKEKRLYERAGLPDPMTKYWAGAFSRRGPSISIVRTDGRDLFRFRLPRSASNHDITFTSPPTAATALSTYHETQCTDLRGFNKLIIDISVWNVRLDTSNDDANPDINSLVIIL